MQLQMPESLVLQTWMLPCKRSHKRGPKIPESIPAVSK